MTGPGIEILSPAGGPDQLVAAIRTGADAVYLGSDALNARRGAVNFACGEGGALEQAVRECHRHGVKVYLTLNTLVREPELAAALGIVEEACRLGMDAVIVQDLGVWRLMRLAAPQLPVCVSTQLSVHNLHGALQCRELGARRVVLAREMSREEISEVTGGCDIETEVFVHGAHCMSVSGQCYMSAVAGARSGNRGVCAQPCRLPFYRGEKGRCGLSLKDLSLVERIPELAALGVTSLKIEGRLKRPEYVAAATAACAAAREGSAVDTTALRAVFSRSGFTSGYFDGRLGPEMFGTRQKEDVTGAAAVLKDFAALYAREVQRVPVSARLVMHAGEPASLALTDGSGNSVHVRGGVPQAAISKPTTADMVRTSLEKLGGTPYTMVACEILLEDGLMLPVSELNRLRRNAVEELDRLRSALHPWRFEAVGPSAPAEGETGRASGAQQSTAGAPERAQRQGRTPSLRARFAHFAQVPQGAGETLDTVILPPAEALRALEGGIDPARIAAEVPTVDFFNYRGIEPDLLRLRELGVRRATAGNLGAVHLLRQLGFRILGDYGFGVMNSRAAEALAELGCESVTLSFELELERAKRIPTGVSRGILAYGHLPLMTVRNCPARAEGGCERCGGLCRMSDRLDHSFYVTCGGTRRQSVIYNNLPVYLADRLPELKGLDFITLYFTVEPPDECAAVLQEYRTGGRRDNITRGLYYRSLT